MSHSAQDKKSTLHQYREVWKGEKKPGRYILCGDRRFITLHIPEREFGNLFGGYCVWKVRNKWYLPDHSSIGVYGKRNVDRLKRILKERGAEFMVIYRPQPKSRLSLIRFGGSHGARSRY